MLDDTVGISIFLPGNFLFRLICPNRIDLIYTLFYKSKMNSYYKTARVNVKSKISLCIYIFLDKLGIAKLEELILLFISFN